MFKICKIISSASCKTYIPTLFRYTIFIVRLASYLLFHYTIFIIRLASYLLSHLLAHFKPPLRIFSTSRSQNTTEYRRDKLLDVLKGGIKGKRRRNIFFLYHAPGLEAFLWGKAAALNSGFRVDVNISTPDVLWKEGKMCGVFDV